MASGALGEPTPAALVAELRWWHGSFAASGRVAEMRALQLVDGHAGEREDRCGSVGVAAERERKLLGE